MSSDRTMRVLAAVALLAILGLSLWVRTRGLMNDLPFIYDPDEPAFLNPSARMLREGDPSPHWFQHPGSTIIYLNAAIMIVSGWLQTGSLNLAAAANAYFADPTAVVWTGRLANAIFGTCAIFATYLVGSRAFQSRAVGIGAASILALIPLHVSYSQIIRTDILAGFFILMAVYFAVRILEERRWQHYVAAGAMIGFGVATKYPAAIAAVPVVVAHFLSVRMSTRYWWLLFVAGTASLAAAFIASPFLFLDIETTLRHLAKEATTSHYSASGTGFFGNLVWYFNKLFRLLGYSGTAAVLVGLVAALVRRGPGLIVMAFAVFFLLFISNLGLRWTRWLIPLMPFVAIFIAVGLVSVAEKIADLFAARTIGEAAALVLSVTLSLWWGGQLIHNRAALADTRTIARHWSVENIPAGSRIIQEFYTPQMPVAKYELFRFRGGKLIPADAETYQNFIPGGFIGESDLEGIQPGDFVMLSSAAYSRFEGTEKWKRYERLLASGEIIYKAEPTRRVSRGPTIVVVRVAALKAAAATCTDNCKTANLQPASTDGANGTGAWRKAPLY